MVTRENYAMEKEIAHYFTTASPEKLSAFLANAPARGTALQRLFESHGGSFEAFVDDVLIGRYFWHGIGWNIGTCLGSFLLLAGLAPKIALAIFEGIFPVENDDETGDLGFGPPSYYVGEGSETGFIAGYLERQRFRESP